MNDVFFFPESVRASNIVKPRHRNLESVEVVDTKDCTRSEY
jgi:hypothetical protein